MLLSGSAVPLIGFVYGARWLPAAQALIWLGLLAALVGGSVYFSAGRALHQQYTAASAERRAVHGTDLVIDWSIALARDRGCRYITFGTSTFGGGKQLNESQYEFKVSFGGGGVTHDQHELSL